jgi:hypothetical protein
MTTRSISEETKLNYEELKSREIVFVPWAKLNEEDEKVFLNACNEVVRLLNEATLTFERNSILAGTLLRKIKATDVWKSVRRSDNSYESYKTEYLKDSFFHFCERYFGLGKSTVYALMEVSLRFGADNGKTLPVYSGYKYSQLVEMCSLSDEDLSSVNPSMTVADIKALKKKKKGADSACPSPLKNSDKESKAVKLSKYMFPEDKLSSKKEEFKKFVKYMFDNFEYSLTLNGRKQGGQAFGGSLFDYLLNKGFFDADINDRQQTLL